MRALHKENHLIERIGWLRAAVLGANDGLISTSSLIVGVAAATNASHEILVAGVAGLVAGAMSMAAGEYVSVSSQADTERADLAREKRELASAPAAERDELAGIYERRGLDPETARIVVNQMTAFDALTTHARDELHITDMTAARPVTAALASAATFTAGASLPLLVAALTPTTGIVALEAIGSLLFLAALGWLGAFAGGAGRLRWPSRPESAGWWARLSDGHGRTPPRSSKE